MKYLLLAVGLAGAMPVSNAYAATALPWFHTRPKPVLLEDQPVTQSRIAYRGAAVYPGSGRLYFENSYDRRARREPPSKPHLADVLARGWHLGTQTSKPKSK
jgi:hypothetical protein